MIVALVPAFNEEKRIGEVVTGAYRFVEKVVVCDDGSTDATFHEATRAGAEVIRHRGNMGYGAALRSLFEMARSFPANAYVTLDSDGQHDSSFIPAITGPIVNMEADLVIGSRFMANNGSFVPAHRKIAIRFITSLCDMATGSEFTDLQSGFRAYNGRALSLSCPVRPGMGASTEIIIKASRAGLKIREIPVQIYYNGERSSPITSARQFIDVISSILRN
jgi:glycosyltransferase involved in cell wall biosynthesis